MNDTDSTHKDDAARGAENDATATAPAMPDRLEAVATLKVISAAAADLPDALGSEAKAARLQLPLQTAGYAIGFVLVSVWLLIRSAA